MINPAQGLLSRLYRGFISGKIRILFRRILMRKILSICFIISIASLFMPGCKTVDEYTGLNSAQIVYDEYKDSKNKSDSDTSSKSSKTGKKAKSDDWGYADNDNSDEHYIQPDDYFIAEEELGKKKWMNVKIAKLVTPATKESKNEAMFMTVHEGNEVWTKIYWKTRMATKADIKIGKVVIAFDGNSDDDVYQAPEDKDQARNRGWFMGKITDVSDLYKGYITMAGGYKVSLNALRIATK